MRLSHVNVTMPKGSEEIARSFYSGLLGLREIPKSECFANPIKIDVTVSGER